MVMETQRLILREMTQDDFDALYKVLADADNMCHYPKPYDAAMVQKWIDWTLDCYAVYGFGLWAVCLKETGEMIGDCGLTMQWINRRIRPEIGYHLRADMHQKGYAKEAAMAVRDWAFQNTPFRTIYSYMTHDNTPSVRTAMAYGCQQVDEYIDEDNALTKVFALSRADWQNR